MMQDPRNHLRFISRLALARKRRRLTKQPTESKTPTLKLVWSSDRRPSEPKK
jgi:hypothetical protein